MFMRNSRYVAGWSHEVASAPAAITRLNEPVVVFRETDDADAALEDHCAHRHLPLSMGVVVGDNLQPSRHGMTFDGGGGRCVGVPGQGFVPPMARVKAYPAIEFYGWA